MRTFKDFITDIYCEDHTVTPDFQDNFSEWLHFYPRESLSDRLVDYLKTLDNTQTARVAEIILENQ